MAIPIINTTTSVLSFAQWHYFEFQPFATEEPTAWSIIGTLPAGITLDEATGLISGAGESDGIYVFGLVATNGSGNSVALVITLRITPSAAPLTTAANLMDIDVPTRTAKLVGAENLFIKEGDDFLIFIRYKNGEVVLDLDVNNILISLKELIGEPVIIESSTWHKFGTGAGAYYALAGTIAREGVAAALSNWETDESKQFVGTAEIETIVNYAAAGWAGAPATLRTTTRDFPITIAADMGEGTVEE